MFSPNVSRSDEPQPPRLGVLLLAALLPTGVADDVVGDLSEVFVDRKEAGRSGVRLWFWGQVLLFSLSFRLLNRRRAASANTRAQNKVVPLSTPPGNRERWFLDMAGLFTRIRQTTRRLRQEWRYSLGVVLILGIGIGPAAAMFSVVQKVLLQPLAYEQPEQLGLLRIDLGELHAHPGAAQSEITDLRAVEGIFAGVEATSREFELSLGEEDDLMPLAGLAVTPGLFELLGVSPAIGRHFFDEDTETPVAIIGHDLWTNRFGQDPEIIGQSLLIDGRATEVVGVMPREFALYLGRGSQLSANIDAWLPLTIRDRRTFWGFPTMVRLADGVSFEQANQGLEAFTLSLVEQYPEIYANTSARFAVHPLLPDLVGQSRPAIQAAFAGVLLLLIIAVANGTALVVARMKAREVDFAVRIAMGAGRGALVQDVLTETAILMTAGIATGGAIAVAAISGLRSLVPDTVPRADNIAFGGDVFGYAAVLGFMGLSLVGLIPAWKASRSAPLQLIQGGGLQRGSTSAHTRFLLVGTQIAMTVVLVFGALQLARSAVQLARTNLHFDANNVLAFRVPLDGNRYDGREQQILFHQELRDQLRGLPSVTAVGAVSNLPLSGTSPMDTFGPSIVGDTVNWDGPLADYVAVLPGYLESIGIEIRQGRGFSDFDNMERQAVAVVDESLAELAWPGEDPIGKTMRMGWGLPVSTVIGVIEHPRIRDISQEVRPQIYVPFGLFPWGPLNFTVRADSDPTVLVGAVRETLAELGPGRAVAGFQLLSDNVTDALSTLRFVTVLVALLAFSAAFLSALGLYAVVSYVVHQTRRATAIRSAMGATPADLLRYHLGNGNLILLVAIPVGIVLCLLSARFVEALLYGVVVRDLGSLAAAALLAIVTGVIGTFIPARSAAREDPARALRAD